MKLNRLDVLMMLFALAGVLGMSSHAMAVEIGSPFGAHMVLQRDKPVAVWGWGKTGENITVTFGEHTAKSTAAADGRWRVSLPAMAARKEGQQLVVKGDQSPESIVLDDVLVGDVWLCSGQSNMTWMVIQSRDGQAEASTATDPLIRYAHVETTSKVTPQDRVKVDWRVTDPRVARHFSAVAYFFARRVRKDVDVPIGLLHASWPGTPGESWVPMALLQREPVLGPMFEMWEERLKDYPQKHAQYLKEYEAWEALPREKRGGKPRPPASREAQHHPANIYNGMIHPLAPMTLRGVLWYQGESNRQRAKQYEVILPLVLSSWRDVFEDDTLPFGIVQLANAGHRRDQPPRNWGGGITTGIRAIQADVASRDKHAGLAVTIDTMIDEGIHPLNKQDVGLRLAMWALGDVYGLDVASSGPQFSHLQRQGSRLILHFDHAEGGIVSRDDAKPGRFQIQDENKTWHWAEAQITGQQVTVWAQGVAKPAHVRYAWEDNPPATLYNAAGLPMVPFTTESHAH